MARCFKITEIDFETFEKATNKTFDCSQLTVLDNGCVYVAIDEHARDKISLPLVCFHGINNGSLANLKI